MAELCGLVAAAGRGSRSGVPYPKTLFKLQGKPILVRIAELLAPYDRRPTVVVSPDGKEAVRKCLREHGLAAHLVVQHEPRGMGDAVLHFAQSPASLDAENVILIWGDIPFISPETIGQLLAAHRTRRNDFTFATRLTDKAYTRVSRDQAGRVTGIVETREAGIEPNMPGERDIGLFVFRPALVLDLLREELAGKWGKATGEHGFLYVVAHLASRGLRVDALPVATEQDAVSFNRQEDVSGLV